MTPGPARRHRDGRDVGLDGALTEALVRTRRFFTKGDGLRRPAHPAPDRRPRGRRLLPGPLEPRQGRPLHPRRELHRLVLVEGLRQGRDHHLGDPADRLPVGRARTRPSTSPAAARAARRSPGTPTRRPGCATRTSAACCCRCTARRRRSTTATRCAAWAHIVENPARARPTSPPAARAAWSGPPGTRPPRSSRRPTCTRSRSTGPDRVAGFSPDPGDVDGLARLRRPVRLPDRRLDAVVLRLVRRPAGRLARRCSATRPTCPSPATGGTPAT